MVYTVTFNPAIDYVVHTREMKLGGTNRSEREEMYFGGKGINVSIVLRELGIKSKALGFTAGVINGDYDYALRLGPAAGGATACSSRSARNESC